MGLIIDALSPFLLPILAALAALVGVGGMKFKAKRDGKKEARAEITNETKDKELKAVKRSNKVRNEVDNLIEFESDERVQRVRSKYGMGKNKGSD